MLWLVLFEFIFHSTVKLVGSIIYNIYNMKLPSKRCEDTYCGTSSMVDIDVVWLLSPSSPKDEYIVEFIVEWE